MRPVMDCRNSAICEFSEAEHQAVVKIVGREDGASRPLGRIVGKASVRNEIASKRAPHMRVGIDEAGHHDHPCRIDDLGAIGIEAWADLRDDAVADEHVGPRQGADGGIQTDDCTAPN